MPPNGEPSVPTREQRLIRDLANAAEAAAAEGVAVRFALVRGNRELASARDVVRRGVLVDPEPGQVVITIAIG